MNEVKLIKLPIMYLYLKFYFKITSTRQNMIAFCSAGQERKKNVIMIDSYEEIGAATVDS